MHRKFEYEVENFTASDFDILNNSFKPNIKKMQIMERQH
jgi:hypothetical protein